MHQADQVIAAEFQPESACFGGFQSRPKQPPRDWNEFYFFAQAPSDFQKQFPERPPLFMRRCQYKRKSLCFPAGVTPDER